MHSRLRTLLIVAGCMMALTAVAAFLLAGTLFTWPTPLPPFWDRIGLACLFLWWLPGLVAGISFFLAFVVR
jgi:hypothetical protein